MSVYIIFLSRIWLSEGALNLLRVLGGPEGMLYIEMIEACIHESIVAINCIDYISEKRYISG